MLTARKYGVDKSWMQVTPSCAASSSGKLLIDGIPVSEDPYLYLAADALGERGQGLHAWEIAPQRYRRGENDRPVRIDIEK